MKNYNELVVVQIRRRRNIVTNEHVDFLTCTRLHRNKDLPFETTKRVSNYSETIFNSIIPLDVALLVAVNWLENNGS